MFLRAKFLPLIAVGMLAACEEGVGQSDNSSQIYGDYVNPACLGNPSHQLCGVPLFRITQDGYVVWAGGVANRETYTLFSYRILASSANSLKVQTYRVQYYENGRLSSEQPANDESVFEIVREGSTKFVEISANGDTGRILAISDVNDRHDSQQRTRDNRENLETFVNILGAVGAGLAGVQSTSPQSTQSRTNTNTRGSPDIRICGGMEYNLKTDGARCVNGRLVPVVCTKLGVCEQQRRQPARSIE